MEVLPIALGIILTLISPFIMAVINKVTWSSETKNLIGIAVSLLIALAYLALTGGIGDWSQLAIVAPAVYGLQQAVYNFLFKDWIKKLEVVTTPGATAVITTTTATATDVTHDKLVATKVNEDTTPIDDLKTTTPVTG